jgi:hypothetical protein
MIEWIIGFILSSLIGAVSGSGYAKSFNKYYLKILLSNTGRLKFYYFFAASLAFLLFTVGFFLCYFLVLLAFKPSFMYQGNFIIFTYFIAIALFSYKYIHDHFTFLNILESPEFKEELPKIVREAEEEVKREKNKK